MTTDISTADLYQLSDNLGAVYGETDASISLYEINPLADEPEAKVVLSDGEMWQLIEYYLDGYCHICGDSVPQHHSLCHDCAIAEERKWHGW